MIRPVSSESTCRLIESDGIGYYLAGPHERASRDYDASKNEIAIESVELTHNPVGANAQGIIAILIGL